MPHLFRRQRRAGVVDVGGDVDELRADGLWGRGAEEGGEVGEDGVGAGLQVV